MPRKKPRPAAKKQRERQARKVKSKTGKPTVGVIGHTPYGGARASLAIALAAQSLLTDRET